jgi:hypothetical protein
MNKGLSTQEVIELIHGRLAARDWRGAVVAAIEHGPLSVREVSVGLKVSIPTVRRWIAGSAAPVELGIAACGNALIELVRTTSDTRPVPTSR